MKLSIRVFIYLLYTLFIITICNSNIYCQKKKSNIKNEDTKQYKNTKGTKYAIWYLPTRAHKINGLAIGLVNSCENQNFQNELIINGISFEVLGQFPIMIKQLVYPKKAPFCHSNYCKINGFATGLSIGNGILNGVAVSPTLGYLFNMNGIFISLIHHVSQNANGIIVGFMSRAKKITGLQLALFTKNNILKGLQIGLSNRTKEQTNGCQIGLINSSENLDGVQIGILNYAKNKKIKYLPIINFHFKKQ
ncbi:MAG: hypothetical protein A2046_12365 [Bacteroidetes bacterium GWA2_30_7]|nr:MAG: hypothetical protein A2046_12365 [Bacteroidetes bacterium GWA2_30_7]